MADVPAPHDGYVQGLDALAVGNSAMRLGAGRQQKGDQIDLSAGIVLHKKIGDQVSAGEPLLTVYGNDESRVTAESAALLAAYAWSAQPVAPPAHIHRIIE